MACGGGEEHGPWAARPRAYHKLMNYQRARVREGEQFDKSVRKKTNRACDASMWWSKIFKGAHRCAKYSPCAIFIPSKSFMPTSVTSLREER